MSAVSEGVDVETDNNMTSAVAGRGLRVNFSRDDLLQVLAAQAERTKYLEPGTELLVIVLYVLLALLGIGGNCLVCGVILRRRHMKTARNMYIFLLAASDLSLCVIIVPHSLVKLLLHNWPLGALMCKLGPTATCSNIYISTICITAMAIDRYQTIVSGHMPSARRSAALHQRDIRRSLLVIGAIVVIGCVLSVPVSLFSYVKTVAPCFQGLGCVVIKSYCAVEMPPWQNVITVVIQYLLPLLVLASTNIAITRFLRRHRAPAHDASAQSRPGAASGDGRKAKAVTLLLAITVVFFVTWLPWNIFNLLIDYTPHLLEPRAAFFLAVAFHLVAFSSACTNPVLYGWLNNNFRAEFVAVFRSCLKSSACCLPLVPRRGAGRGRYQHPPRVGNSCSPEHKANTTSPPAAHSPMPRDNGDTNKQDLVPLQDMAE